MPISEVASLIGGAALGAPFSEVLALVIAEAKKVKDFKALSEDLATMERLVPVLKEIDSMQEGSGPGKGELKVLIKTVQRAEEIVRKCSRVQWYSIAKKALYTRAIKGINQDFLRFCQIELQLIQHRNLLQSMRSMATVSTKNDLLSDTGKEFAELFIVPQPQELTLSWLDRPFRELKKMLFEDGVVPVVVSAPSACGKTSLVAKLCHDADVKGKFKQIFFITVSNPPNLRLIIERLLQHSGFKASEYENNLDTSLCIQQLLKQLRQNGSMLLVLDDVWHEEESLLEKFLIQLPDYKILVTSRVEFSTFGPTFQLESFIDEDVKNLFINCLSWTRRDPLLQKILKRCNGLPLAMNPPCRICGGCNSVIEHEVPVNVLGVLWHPECFCCDASEKPIAAIQEFENHVSNARGKFHECCYEQYCYVCKEKKLRRYNQHHFWREKYCPTHESDGTPKCCSCERLKAFGAKYVMLDDGRWLCRECMGCAVMDTYECHSLHFEILDFFEALNMKVEKEFPLLLVEQQALNEDKEEEESIVLQGPRMGWNNQLISMVMQSRRVVHEGKVTAIHIVYGLPRLLTGYILAYEMMHAYLRLNGYIYLNKFLEEGICKVIGHMWLESQRYVPIIPAAASSSASSSSRTPVAASVLKKGEWSDFERRLVDFCEFQIETDESPVYGDGFRKVNMMVTNSSLQETLKEILRLG